MDLNHYKSRVYFSFFSPKPELLSACFISCCGLFKTDQHYYFCLTPFQDILEGIFGCKSLILIIELNKLIDLS